MIDQAKAKEAFESYLEKAKNDDRIVGILFGGGRAKGVATPDSDYDLILVTTDEGRAEVEQEYPKTEYVDSLPYAISDFRERAKIGTRTAYDKYTFTHNKVLVDKTGEIQKLVDEKGTLFLDEAQKIAHDALGGYLNTLYRSLKNFRDKNELAGHLDATETIPRILTFVFAVENRVRPFNKFLAWELENYPLQKLSIEPAEFLTKVQKILTTGDFDTQKEMLVIIKELALKTGYEDRVAEWDGYWFG